MGQPRPSCPSCSAAIAGDARFCGACGYALSPTERAAHAPPSDLSGREIAGRYTLLQRLGQGGMGAVYRARQESLKREVAIKLLKPELSNDPGLVRRFNKEAELAARLNHPNTVTLYDFGQDQDGALFIAMELVDGRSLREVLVREGALPAARALAICSQVAASLADAHAVGIVHRDLKPDNVMLSVRGREQDVVRVLDFGIAKLKDPGGDVTAMPVTQAGDLLGTPQYMAPEQIRGEPVDGRTDVYAMGAMLYEMVTGRMPFEGHTVMSILGKHLTDAPVPPSTRRPDLGVPPPIDQLVLAAMQKDPAHRPPSMEAFGDQVARLRAHLAPTAGAQVPRRTTRPPGVPLSIEELIPPALAAAQPPPAMPPQPAYAPPVAAPTPGQAAYGAAHTPPPQHVYPQTAPPRSGPNLAVWVPVVLALMAGIVGVFALAGKASKPNDKSSAAAGGDDRGAKVLEHDGDTWRHPTLGYSLLVPEDYTLNSGSSSDLAMWSGELSGDYVGFIGLSAHHIGGDVTDDLLRSNAIDLINASGARLVDSGRRTYQGGERWSFVYDLPANDTRWQMVLFGHKGAVIAIAFGTARAAFDTTASLRDELFARRLILP